MVKKTEIIFSFAEWRKQNPVESDIMDLIQAAQRYADSLEPYFESDESEQGPARVDDTLSELEMTIDRAKWAIHAMMQVPQARKAAGLKRRVRGRDKSFDPEKTSVNDPQVQVVLEMLRGNMKRSAAFSKVAEIIAPKGGIDERTLKKYVEDLTGIWGGYADPHRTAFWVETSD